jgi:nucleoside-diphosphate-sugar epimerase
MSKKIFLTSGTGYIGLHVAKAAKAAGHDVTALARSDAAAARLQEFGVKPHRGDLKKPETWRDVLKQFDVVIHTAATNDQDFRSADEQAVNTIIEALKGTDKAFVYTSGVWVLGNTGDKPATADTPPNPAKLVAWRPPVEQKVRDAAKQGVRSSVIRPGVVYGHGGGIVGQYFAHAKQNGEAIHIGNGENRWSVVHVDDLARLYLLAAEKAPAGTLVHGTNDQPVKQREVAEWVAQAAGVPGKVKSITPEQATQSWGPYVEGLLLDQYIQSPQAKRILGWEPKAPSLAEDLKQNVKEFATPRK